MSIDATAPADGTSDPDGDDLPLHGLLVVDKPVGWTSHDVVAKVRRITGVRRVGHAGTLDPAATGVLPVGVGQGTRVLEYLSATDKAYRATIRVGARTDTDDADGTVIEQRDWHGVTPADVRQALSRFVGLIDQVPPAYSAIKQHGVALHRLARRGVEVTPATRQVTIWRIDILDLTLPDVTIEVTCSKGTYVRSLARDLGDVLGCGAHLAALRRLRTGIFAESDAHTLEHLAAIAEAGGLPALLFAPDVALLAFPAIIVGAAGEDDVVNGRLLASVAPPPPAMLARVYGDDGAFLATVSGAAGGWQPEKVFARP